MTYDMILIRVNTKTDDNLMYNILEYARRNIESKR